MRNETRTDEETRIDRSIFGVEYKIPLPWPQDRPPDEKYLGSHTRDNMRMAKEYRSDKTQLGVKYGISPLAAGPPP